MQRFSDMRNVWFVYKWMRYAMNGVFQRDQLTCDLCGNPIHSRNWQWRGKCKHYLLYFKFCCFKSQFHEFQNNVPIELNM